MNGAHLFLVLLGGDLLKAACQTVNGRGSIFTAGRVCDLENTTKIYNLENTRNVSKIKKIKFAYRTFTDLL